MIKSPRRRRERESVCVTLRVHPSARPHVRGMPLTPSPLPPSHCHVLITSHPLPIPTVSTTEADPVYPELDVGRTRPREPASN